MKIISFSQKKMKTKKKTTILLLFACGIFALYDIMYGYQQLQATNFNRRRDTTNRYSHQSSGKNGSNNDIKSLAEVLPVVAETHVESTGQELSRSTVEERTSRSNNKKNCVIHVGPHKTGSSTLQKFIYSKDMKHVTSLKEDNYRLPVTPVKIGRFKTVAPLAHCFFTQQAEGLTRPDRCPPGDLRDNILEYFRSFVSDAARDGSNILLSAEAFDDPYLNITELTNYLVPHYNIHVVIYYRRFYDWIYSFFNQVAKSSNGRRNDISFVEWLSSDRLEQFKHMHAAAVYERYKAFSNFNVSVVNMHIQSNLYNPNENFDSVSTFFCNYVDHAPNTCALAKSKQVQYSNPSQDLDWNLFRSDVQRYHSIQLSQKDERWKQIEEKFHEMKTIHDTNIPKICLSPKWKNVLLQLSLEYEIALTPTWWHNSEEGLVDLKSDFQQKINSKLCSIDARTILTSPDWQRFLTELERRRSS